MPAARPTGPTTALVPARWRSDRLLCSQLSLLDGAGVVADDDALLLLPAVADGPSISGYGPGSGRLLAGLVERGEVAAPLRWLDLPREARLDADSCARLAVEPLPGWDWMVATRPPTAPTLPVVRLDLARHRGAIEDCLAEANPGTWARPGADDDLGWWGVRGPDGLLGVIGASRRDGARPGSTSWHLHGLGVRPSARGRGHGGALTAAATRAGLAGGADWVSLGVWADNRTAIDLYHRLGFATEHRRGSYQPRSRPVATARGCG
ncbi:MAG: N-acetyltransferase [Propionicimonas sp.]|nr:N-acetyltransferase [Propionicimonas sp.]